MSASNPLEGLVRLLKTATPRVPPNYANNHMGWQERTAHKRRDQAAVQLVLTAAVIDNQEFARAALPALAAIPDPVRARAIVLRLRARNAKLMDFDNLAHRMKHVRDSVAKAIGVDDRETEQLTWIYESTGSAGGSGVEIEVWGKVS